MTEAVSSAGQNSIIALVAPPSPKAGGKERAHGKAATNDALSNEERSEDAPREARQGDEPAAKPAVQEAQKPSRRTHHDRDKKDDHDTSFEATIDSIDHSDQSAGQSPNQAAAIPQMAAWTAALMAGQTPADQSAKSGSGKSGDANTAASNVPNATAQQPVLKQDRVSALMLARQRLLASDTSMFESAGQSSEQVVNVPAVVRSQETHWSFATAPATSLQALSASAGPTKEAASAAASAVNASAKTDNGSALKASDSIKPAATETASLDSTDDAAGQQSSGEQRNAGAGSQDQQSSDIKARESSQVTASKSSDKTSASDKSTPTGISNAAQQVQTTLLGALTGEAAEAQPTSAAPNLQNRLVNPGQVVRTIELTLSPADLGSVSLRLSLRSNVLTIEAEASKASTAKLLNDDRHALEQNLRDAGYDVSSLKITDAGTSGATSVAAMTATAAAATPASSASGMQFQDNGQSRLGFAQQQGGNMQRGDGSTPDRSQQRSRGDNPQSSPVTDAGNSRHANAIYI